jgi:hypothetical protein
MRAAPVLGAWLAATWLPVADLEPQRLYRHEANRLSMACVYAIEAYGSDAMALPVIQAWGFFRDEGRAVRRGAGYGAPARGRRARVLNPDERTTSGTAADALDNALFVLGPQESRAYLRTVPDVEAFFFLPAAKQPWTMVHIRSGV